MDTWLSRAIEQEAPTSKSMIKWWEHVTTSGEIIGCPIIRNSTSGPLHIWMATEENEGYIQCEKLALLDMSLRGYKKVDRLSLSEMINISDAIQGIFEYI